MTSGSPEPTEPITVPLSRLASDRVPQVCLKTGEAAQCLVPTVAAATPRWAWWLIVPGGAPYFAARRWWFPREVLALPARNRISDQVQHLRQATIGLFAVVAVVAVWSIITLQLLGVVTAAAAGAATTAGWLLLTPKMWVGAELRGDHVLLTGVHSSAARALRGA